MNLPAYDYISAPLWLLSSLHVLMLTLHFAAMSFVVGGLLFVFFGKLEGGISHPAAKKIIELFPSIMAATITLGVAPLLFLQLVYPGPVYSASIASGWLWLAVIGAAIGAYYLLYAAAFAPADRKLIWLGLAVPLFLYISLVYSSVFSMAERPGSTNAASSSFGGSRLTRRSRAGCRDGSICFSAPVQWRLFHGAAYSR